MNGHGRFLSEWLWGRFWVPSQEVSTRAYRLVAGDWAFICGGMLHKRDFDADTSYGNAECVTQNPWAGGCIDRCVTLTLVCRRVCGKNHVLVNLWVWGSGFSFPVEPDPPHRTPLITAAAILVAAVTLTQLCRTATLRRLRRYQPATIQTRKNNLIKCASTSGGQHKAITSAASYKVASKEGDMTQGQALIAMPGHITAVENPVLSVITDAATGDEGAVDCYDCDVPRANILATSILKSITVVCVSPDDLGSGAEEVKLAIRDTSASCGEDL